MRAGGGISRQAALPCLCCFVVGGGLIISLPFFFLNFGSTGNGRGEKSRTIVRSFSKRHRQGQPHTGGSIFVFRNRGSFILSRIPNATISTV